MNKISNNQKGFSTFEALAGIVILAMLVFVGWYVVHANQTTSKIYNQTSKSTAQKPQTKATTDTTTATAQSTTDNSSAAPSLVYIPDGKFTASDRAELRTKLIQPIEDHFKNKLASISVRINDNTASDDKYVVEAILKPTTDDIDGQSGYYGFVYGSKTKGLDAVDPKTFEGGE